MSADLLVFAIAIAVPVICLFAVSGIVSTLRQLERARAEEELRLARR